jgi:hypothetical protein
MLLLGRRTSAALVLSAEAVSGAHPSPEIAAGAIAMTSERILLKAKAKARTISRDAFGSEDVDRRLPEKPAIDDRLARVASAGIAARFLELSAEHETRAEAVEALGSRLDLIATTESWRALNDETIRIAKHDEGGSWLVWSAQADACELCWEFHGDRVPADEGFLNDPPLHPRCRCVLLVE